MIVDSSFLVPFFIEEHEFNKRALQEIKKHIGEQLVVLDRVLEETFTVITYKKGIAYALDVLEQLEENKDVIIFRLDGEDFYSIIELIRDLKTKLSFVDYAVLHLSISRKEMLLCFDEQLLASFKKQMG
ncbi:PIN domain-containing protein [Candidatus Micrarchaeota archaeon]|nr:PIN domain-containing protein [Candidatus Micrarchaeota archaeon]